MILPMSLRRIRQNVVEGQLDFVQTVEEHCRRDTTQGLGHRGVRILGHERPAVSFVYDRGTYTV